MTVLLSSKSWYELQKKSEYIGVGIPEILNQYHKYCQTYDY